PAAVGCKRGLGRVFTCYEPSQNLRADCSVWIREVVVLVLAEPLAEEQSAGHRRHCGKHAAMQFMKNVVYFVGLDRGGKLAEDGDEVWEMQLFRN
ncbi:MAG: hypothetical protein WBC51_08240, partial [Vicinamibacterales bacterium]